jgi:septal ring factor EnvC (AmiA/AmiB activator)
MATAKTKYPADLDKAIKDLDKKILDASTKLAELEATKIDYENQKPVREAATLVGQTFVKRGTCRTNGEGVYARVLNASEKNPGNVTLEVFQSTNGGRSASFERVEMYWVDVQSVYEPLAKAEFDGFRAKALEAIG